MATCSRTWNRKSSSTASSKHSAGASSSVRASTASSPRSLRNEAQAAERSLAHLTEREKDILGCLAKRPVEQLIARDLNIAEGTVKVHIKNLLKKLKFRSRLEAAVSGAVDRTQSLDASSVGAAGSGIAAGCKG